MLTYGKIAPCPYGMDETINNATAYQRKFLKDRSVCQYMRENSRNNCHLVWISTHFRPKEMPHHSEHPEWTYANSHRAITQYNEVMREWFESKNCGKQTKYIDVFNMTRQLVSNFYLESQNMTYDGCHYGAVVNLLKAQIVIYL